KCADDVDPGAVRQLEVDEEDVGPHEGGAAEGLGDGPRLGDDGQPLGAVDDLGDAPTDHLVVVDDHHPDVVPFGRTVGAHVPTLAPRGRRVPPAGAPVVASVA